MSKKLIISCFLYLFIFSISIVAKNGIVSDSRRFKYVNTEEEFRLHMESHIVRVQILALYIYHNFPEYFPHLIPELIKAFMRLHDQSKINQTVSFLKKHNLLRFGNSILTMLHKGYGNEDPEYFKQHLKPVVDLLNAIDNTIRGEFYTYRGFVLSGGIISAAGGELSLLEKASDQLDRRLDPVAMEEFGEGNHKEAIRKSHFFHQTELGRAILEHMESPSLTKPGLTTYEGIVEGFTFEHMMGNRPLAACLGAQIRYLTPYYSSLPPQYSRLVPR